MRNFFAHAWLLSFFLVSVAPSVADTLCQKDEVTFFSCEIKGSAKVASLCGSPQLDAHRGYVQYRFGRVGKIELTFPQERQNSQQSFFYAHYFRAQVDRTEVTFQNGSYQYAVYDDYEGEEKPGMHAKGVRVEASTSTREVDFICTGKPVSNLAALQSVIACDANSGLNLDGCPEGTTKP